jgi:hypothetical protein
LTEDLHKQRKHFKYLDQWEQAVIAAWANSARIEQTAPGTYAARLPNNRLVGVYNQGQGGWVESPGSADMDEQAVAEAGPFSYGAKKPRQGTVAHTLAQRRRAQDLKHTAIEPRDQQVGVAKIITGHDLCPACSGADIKTHSDGEKECNQCHRTWDVKGMAEGKESDIDASNPEDMKYANETLADIVNSKFKGRAWFNGGSYSYLIDTKKPNIIVASDGSKIQVKSWAHGLHDYVDRWAWHELATSYPDYWETMFRPAEKIRGQGEHEYLSRMGENQIGVMENAEQLDAGDDVVITGRNNVYQGKTGYIVDFGQDKRFVIVQLYNHGRHSFDSSDVSRNEYADSEEEHDEWNDIKEASDISGLMAASHLNKQFRIQATGTDNGKPFSKSYRVKAQSARVAKEKLMRYLTTGDRVLSDVELGDAVEITGESVNENQAPQFDSYKEADRYLRDLAHEKGMNPVDLFGKGDFAQYQRRVFQLVKSKEGEKIKEAGETRHVLYLNGKAAAHYATPNEARQQADLVLKKFPNTRVEIRPAQTGLAEEQVRLDAHCWQNKKIGNPKTKLKGGVRVNNCVPK